MVVSENSGTPKSSILIGFSIINIYKPSILGYPYFWKHPYSPYHPWDCYIYPTWKPWKSTIHVAKYTIHGMAWVGDYTTQWFRGLFHTLSGGFKDSWIFYTKIWGFMIQFDLRIFFRWVGWTKPPTRCLMAASEHSLHPKKRVAVQLSGEILNKNLTKDCNIWGFPKMVVPNNQGLPTKNDHFGVFWGYHHLRKHPYQKLKMETPPPRPTLEGCCAGEFEE